MLYYHKIITNASKAVLKNLPGHSLQYVLKLSRDRLIQDPGKGIFLQKFFYTFIYKHLFSFIGRTA